MGLLLKLLKVLVAVPWGTVLPVVEGIRYAVCRAWCGSDETAEHVVRRGVRIVEKADAAAAKRGRVLL